MSSLKALMGRTVMDRANAEKLGKIGGVVLDTSTPGTVRFGAVRISGAGSEREFADWSHLTGSGDDAVVVDGGSHLRPAASAHETLAQAGDADLLGKRVLTDHGNEVGTLEDVEFDAASGEVEFVAAAGERIPGERIRSVGPYAVIVTCPHEGACPG